MWRNKICIIQKVWRNKIFEKMKISFTSKLWRKEIPRVYVLPCKWVKLHFKSISITRKGLRHILYWIKVISPGIKEPNVFLANIWETRSLIRISGFSFSYYLQGKSSWYFGPGSVMRFDCHFSRSVSIDHGTELEFSQSRLQSPTELQRKNINKAYGVLKYSFNVEYDGGNIKIKIDPIHQIKDITAT